MPMRLEHVREGYVVQILVMQLNLWVNIVRRGARMRSSCPLSTTLCLCTAIVSSHFLRSYYRVKELQKENSNLLKQVQEVG